MFCKDRQLLIDATRLYAGRTIESSANSGRKLAEGRLVRSCNLCNMLPNSCRNSLAPPLPIYRFETQRQSQSSAAPKIHKRNRASCSSSISTLRDLCPSDCALDSVHTAAPPPLTVIPVTDPRILHLGVRGGCRYIAYSTRRNQVGEHRCECCMAMTTGASCVVAAEEKRSQ